MVGAVFNRACMYCARGVFIFSLRAFFVGAPGPVSIGQDRLILPDGDQAIAIYRGAPACGCGRRGLKPRLTYCAADKSPRARPHPGHLAHPGHPASDVIAIKGLTDLFSVLRLRAIDIQVRWTCSRVLGAAHRAGACPSQAFSCLKQDEQDEPVCWVGR